MSASSQTTALDVPAATTIASVLWRDDLTSEQVDEMSRSLHAWLTARAAEMQGSDQELYQYKSRKGAFPGWYDEGTGPTPAAWHEDCVQPEHIWRRLYVSPERNTGWRPTYYLGKNQAGDWLGAWKLDGEPWVIDKCHIDIFGVWTRTAPGAAMTIVPPLFVRPLPAPPDALTHAQALKDSPEWQKEMEEARRIVTTVPDPDTFTVTADQLRALIPRPYMHHHKMDEVAERDARTHDRVRDHMVSNVETLIATRRATGYAPPTVGGDEDDYVIVTMGRLLAEIAITLKGPEPAGTAWSYHDLPQMVRAAAELARRVECAPRGHVSNHAGRVIYLDSAEREWPPGFGDDVLTFAVVALEEDLHAEEGQGASDGQ